VTIGKIGYDVQPSVQILVREFWQVNRHRKPVASFDARSPAADCCRARYGSRVALSVVMSFNGQRDDFGCPNFGVSRACRCSVRNSGAMKGNYQC
jgi:hypothetical protein